MHLRALELHGFKTFAAPTRLEFSPRITAIVGPNGAGKSNIVDALRWALGETSFQLLRARKTEDLIFAGSPNRARAGMAEVTLLLDNGDAALPVDFAEVSLTRRAYRDGRGEFLLNGQRVRLRDVKELLAQAGLSEGAHVFIGQGMVDAILALRPEDRRALFEEAAGIGLVRQRREEALRRLDATRRNMERAQDLLAELEPRLRRLERQMQRGRQLEALQEELRQHLRVWYGYRWQQAVQAVQDALQAHHEAQRAWDAAQARLRAAEAAQQQRFARIRALREQRQTLVSQVREAQRAWQAEDRRRQQAEEQLRRLDRERSEAQTALTRAQETLAFHQEALQSLAAQVQQREQAWQEARDALEAARIAFEEARAARRQAQKALDRARREVQRLTQEQAALQARAQTLAQQMDELDALRQRHAQQQAALEQRRRAAEEAWHQAQDAYEQARGAEQQAQAAAEQARAALQQAEAEQRRLQQALTALQARFQRLQARLEGLRQAERDLVGHDEAARFVLQQVRGRVRGLLGPYLAVEEAHEVAIAAALDLWAEAVLVPGDPDELLDQVRNAPGRVLLFPQQPPTRGEPPPPPRAAGVLGSAADLVRVAPEAQAATQALLGWVWVVEDRATARRVRSQAPPGVWVVTLAGEAYAPQGGVVVGRPKGRAVLQRTRERRALEADLAALQKDLDAQQAQLRQAEQTLQQARDALQRARQRAREAQKRAAQAREAAQQKRLAYEQARQALTLHQQQQAEAQARWARARDALNQVQQQAQDLAQTLEQARAALREKQRALAQVDLDAARQAMTYWEAQAQVAQRAWREARQQHQARAQKVQQTQSQIQALAQKSRHLDAAWEQARQSWQAAQNRSRDLWARVEALQAQLEPLEAELQALEAEHDAAQTALRQAREQAQRAEQRAVQARLALARARDRLHSLQRQIHDDFGPVALEAPPEVWGEQPLPLAQGVERLPSVAQAPPDLEETIRRLRGRMRRLGPPPGPELRQEYETLAQRVAFLHEQLEDLRRADHDLQELIAELDATMRREFRRTFDAVNRAFGRLFTRLFGGGKARLVLQTDDQGRPQGVDIEARLPGKRAQRLAVLSGGERSLTAVALIFALLQVSPTPFCVLDEVDAMLDEANVVRFGELVQELSRETQFLIITHNRHTVQIAEVLYGVTMRDDGTSQVLSVKVDEVERHLQPASEVAA